jgi:hypothetical protein
MFITQLILKQFNQTNNNELFAYDASSLFYKDYYFLKLLINISGISSIFTIIRISLNL